ncbi:MAG: hypothetical protein K6G68_11440 [Oscillospiraceae bacterium]|nr:hypothetical protein [Oscillospiraceae bacterium]
MQELFTHRFTIKIDTSACTSMVAGTDPALGDTWYYSDQVFESGKIYGLVSEYGQGSVFLSYLCGGGTDAGNDGVKITCNDVLVTCKELGAVSHILEPAKADYGKLVVRKAIEKALSESGKGSIAQIMEKFMLTPDRSDRKFTALSGERWKAAAAYGFALGRRIFYAPYMTSSFYYRMLPTGLIKALRELTESGAVILLPVGSDSVVKHFADEIRYLDRKFVFDNERLGASSDYIH